MKLLNFMILGFSIPLLLVGKPMTFVNSIGESFEVEVEESEPFLGVLDKIHSYYDKCEKHSSPQSSLLSFDVSSVGITVRSKQLNWRDYAVPASRYDKKDIHFIITTLANDSLIGIASSRSSLKRAGERIDYLHPFRFLMTIFSHEELKAGAHAIRDRGGLVWNGFTDGIVGSLKEESANKNVLQFVPDFAKKLKIDPALILPSLEKGKWIDFVNILIDKIPRAIDPNRYDM